MKARPSICFWLSSGRGYVKMKAELLSRCKNGGVTLGEYRSFHTVVTTSTGDVDTRAP